MQFLLMTFLIAEEMYFLINALVVCLGNVFFNNALVDNLLLFKLE